MENEAPTTQASHLDQPNEDTRVPDNVTTDGGDFVGRDQIIHGDEVHGDKVLGDKITFTEESAYTVYGLASPYLG